MRSPAGADWSSPVHLSSHSLLRRSGARWATVTAASRWWCARSSDLRSHSCSSGFSQDVYQLLAFRIVQGAISGFIASSLALVSANTPRERMGYAMGFMQSSTAGGMVLGPFIGGLLADLIGYRAIFFVTAGLCAIAGILVVLLVTELNKVHPQARRYTVHGQPPAHVE